MLFRSSLPKSNGYSRYLPHVCNTPSAIESQDHVKWDELTIYTVKEKKYTEDHEWIEMSADGKTCMSTLPQSPRIPRILDS